MKFNVQNQIIIVVLLIFTLLVSSFTEAEARRRRKYSPAKTKTEAIEIIRSGSEEVSKLAGLKPMPKDSISSEIIKKLSLESEDESLSEEIGDMGENLDELERDDDVTISIDEFNTLWLSFLETEDEASHTPYGVKKQLIMDAIMNWLGTPYRFGGTTQKAIDCSAFTQKIFLETADLLIPRTAREQVKIGDKISRDKLEFGDLIFFHTYSRRFASHVGIYLGDNLFAHASSRNGVTIGSLESTYYKKRFIGGRRLNSKDMVRFSILNNNH